ncbi:MFS transporter [Chryseobacterium sp.]|nr:MFS transporter [Chryseobacterium sp.]
MGIVILQLAGSGISYAKLGILEAFKDLPIALISLFAAGFITRFGGKKSLTFSLLVVGCCCFLLPLVEAFWFFKIWFTVIGLCFAIAKISVYGIIRNSISSESLLAKVMSSVEASFMIGIFVVNIGFGWLISSAYSDYWKYGFWLISLLAFLTVLLLQRSVTNLRITTENKGSIITVFKFFTKKNLLFFLTVFCIVFIEQNFNSWLPSFYKIHLGVNSFFALQATAFLALFSYIGRMVTSRIIQNFSLSRYFSFCVLLLLSVLLSAHFLLLNGFQQISLFLFPLIGLFLAPLYPVVSSGMITTVSRSDVNVFTSILVIFSSLGSSFGSVSMSLIFQYDYGKDYALLISGAAVILFVISFLYFRYHASEKTKKNI